MAWILKDFMENFSNRVFRLNKFGLNNLNPMLAK